MTMVHHFVLLTNAVNTYDVHGRFRPPGLGMGFQISKEYLDMDASVLLSLNLITKTQLSISSIQRNQSQKEGCIPVECVPPAPYHTEGCLYPGGSLSRGVSVWGCLCPGGSLSRGVSVRETPPPVDRQTPVKILPCPKLRLRAVKTEKGVRI